MEKSKTNSSLIEGSAIELASKVFEAYANGGREAVDKKELEDLKEKLNDNGQMKNYF